MKLLYYRGQHPNFGDDMNTSVWPALAPELFTADDGHGFLGIGTLIGRSFPGPRTVHVFSSGVGYESLMARRPDYRYWSVRGPLSVRALDLPADRAIIDGGVLAPEVLGIVKAAIPDKRPVVVPHWESILEGGWDEACALAGYRLVDPMGSPEEVIRAIAQAPLVITESLHGAIMAEVLRVPWVAIVTTANVPLFKWCDWTSSIGLPLRMTPIQPPMQTALTKFGRPGIGAQGRPITIGEDQAFGHFSRWGMVPRDMTSSHRWSVHRISRGVQARLDERLRGVSPARTARALVAAASVEPQLGEAGVIEARKAELLARLDTLRSAYADNRLAQA